MFNKVFLEPPAYLQFPLADMHQFTIPEMNELHAHFQQAALTQWGCPEAVWTYAWGLYQTVMVPGVARFPNVLHDESVLFQQDAPEPTRKVLNNYHDAVRTAYVRRREQYKTFPKMGCAIMFTAPAKEWAFFDSPVVIVANSPDTLLLATYLSVGLVNEEARAVRATKSAPRAKVERDPQRSERYTAWLQACEDHKAHVEELRQDYEQRFHDMEESRRAWRALQAQGAPKWVP